MNPDTFPSGVPRPDLAALSSGTRALVVTGMSGAGKTRAAAALQDAGWYVVDNLPPHMLFELLTSMGGSGVGRVAAVIDVRGGKYFADLSQALADLDDTGIDIHVMFLDATDSALVQRFEEARRPHPLQSTTLILAVQEERDKLSEVRSRADITIDTSDLNVHELRDRVLDSIGHEDQSMRITVESFGFKRGVPVDAEFIADVRFLDNPHWVQELRPLTGTDPQVREHVLTSDGASDFLDTYMAMLESVLPRFRPRDRHNLIIGIGCTGGRHRSVAIAEELAQRLRSTGIEVHVHHRDRDAKHG